MATTNTTVRHSNSPRAITMPTPETVGQIMGGLLGRPVAAKKSTPLVRSDKTPTVTAVYVGDDSHFRGVVICDIALASNAGAALTLFPPPDAAQAIKAGRWNEGLAENFNEVLNVSANLFNSPGSPHARLSKVHLSPDALPAEVLEAMKKPVGRVDIEVTIPGYGPGKMTVLAF